MGSYVGRVSTGFVVTLACCVVVVLTARLLVPSLPLRRTAVTLSATEVAATLLGLVTLAFHCGAMFFQGLTERLPATDGVIEAIRALGNASILWYAVPALLMMLGLRRLPWLALSSVGLALLAVGVTMYDGGPLETHLTAIFVAVSLLAVVLATSMILPPHRAATTAAVSPHERP